MLPTGSDYPYINHSYRFTSRPYTIEDQLEDSLGLNSFSTSERGQLCIDQVSNAIREGSRKFIINLQDNNCREYGQVFATHLALGSGFENIALRREMKIEIRFDQNFASQFNPVQLQNHLMQSIQLLNAGMSDCIRFPNGMAANADQIYRNLASMNLVHQAIIPNHL